MTTYVDVFGNTTLPPSEYGYVAVTLSANTTFSWPYTTSGANLTAKIMDVSAASVGLALTLPPATEVSTGEDLLVRNVGSNSLSVKSNDGTLLATVAAGAAKYFYLTDNSTDGGTWGTVAYGVGTSSVDAASLVGYGITAIGATLNQAHEVFPSATDVTIDDTYRAKMVLFTGGSGTCALPASTTVGNDFFFILRNGGTGTLTIDPDSAETIDGLATLDIQPSESLLLFCSGSAWYSVGYGRSVLYNFTQLVKDVSAAGTFTLSSSEAANKLLTFTGNPASAVTVVVPNVVAVYYILSSISTTQSITVKTAAGSGVSVPQSQRVIAICDSSNVYSAQSISASTTVTLVDGSAASPSLAFASSTDTGLFKYGVDGVGITSNGSEVAHFDSSTGNVITGALTASSTVNSVGNFTVNTNKLSVTASNGNTTWASGAALSIPSGSLSVGSIGAFQLTGNITSTGNPSLNLGSGALTAGSGAFSGALKTSTGGLWATGTLSSRQANTLIADNNGGETRYYSHGANTGTYGSHSFYATSSDGSLNINVAQVSSTGLSVVGAGTSINSYGVLTIAPTDRENGGLSLLVKTSAPNASARSWGLFPNYNVNGELDITYGTAGGGAPTSRVASFSSTGLAVTGEVSLANGSLGGTLKVGGNGTSTGGSITYDNSGATTLSFNSHYDSASAVMNWKLRTNGTPVTAMTLDASGNLGLGVTPSAYSAGIKAFEVGSVGSALIGNGSNDFYMTQGAYYNAGWKYAKSATNACRFGQASGALDWSIASGSGKIAGDPLTWTAAMTLDASGNLLVGASSVNFAGSGFTLSSNSGTTKWLTGPYSSAPNNFYIASSGSTGVYLNGTAATAWSSNSDERLKTDLKPITDAAQKVASLRAVTGRYLSDEVGVSRSFLIAQDVQAVLPEAVATTTTFDGQEVLGLAYTDTIPLLVAAIKELTARLAALEAK